MADPDAARPDVPGVVWEGPLFLIGMPRSGTKLLRSLLTRHARVRIPMIETEFLPFLISWVGKNGEPRSEAHFHSLYTTLRTATYFDYRSEYAGEFSWREWMRHCGPRRDAAGLFEGFIRYETTSTPGTGIIWGDKSPTYIRYVNRLLRMYPSAKVIHIVRDVRDHCLSMHKAWGKDMPRAAQRWSTDTTAVHLLAVANPGQVLELRYEDLTRQPDKALRRVCDFVGLDFSPSLLDLEYSPENLGDTRGRSGIVGDNILKYRARLSPRQIRIIEELAWQGMHDFGYVPELAVGPCRLGSVSLVLRKVKDGCNLVIRDVEQRGFGRSLRFYMRHRRQTRLPL